MNVTRGPVRVVKPRDLADWPVFTTLAWFFWGWAAGLMVLLAGLFAVVSVLVASGGHSPWSILATPTTQVGVAAAVLAALYVAPGFCRLSRAARLALLGPLACAVPVFVFLWAWAKAA
jgi:hypothetical protein